MGKPNIILINCDDLGFGDLGCYGSPYNKTPYLDELAAQGMRFTDFYVASSVCSPSRGALMTGCYPKRIGFGSFDGRGVLFPGQPLGLHRNEITIAKLLQQDGYATKMVGKWHCGDQPEFLPTQHGFDSYFGLPYSNDMGRQPGAITYPPLPLLRDTQVIQQQPDQAALTERYVDESVRFLRECKDQPFFLYFAHMYVHVPIYAPWRFLKQSVNGAYGAAVECIDWSVGVLMHELDRLGLTENTIVLFTSDNGSRARCEGGSNAPLRGTKGTMWEGGMRVPLIVRWPGKTPHATVCAEMVTAMDLLPTLAQAAGVNVPTDRVIDGKDITTLLTNTPGATTPHSMFGYFQLDTLAAVRSGNWKLFMYRDGTPLTELYDLATDIGETSNRAQEFPAVVKGLREQADAIRADLGDAAIGCRGAGCRPIGRVAHGRTLTEYDPAHPYMVAMYDLPHRG